MLYNMLYNTLNSMLYNMLYSTLLYNHMLYNMLNNMLHTSAIQSFAIQVTILSNTYNLQLHCDIFFHIFKYCNTYNTRSNKCYITHYITCFIYKYSKINYKLYCDIYVFGHVIVSMHKIIQYICIYVHINKYKL